MIPFPFQRGQFGRGRANVGGDPNFANVVALLHLDGTNGSTTIVDSSPLARSFTCFNEAAISTAQSKFGGASAVFDGNQDSIQASTTTDYDLGDTYTIELWARATSTAGNSGLLHRGFYNNTNNTWVGLAFSMRQLGTTLRCYFFATTAANERFIDAANALAANTWKHIAMVRNGSSGQVFVDGVSAGTISSLSTPAASSESLRIGLWNFTGGIESFGGHMDEIRITKVVARYTANFTPAVDAFPNS